MCLVPVTNRRFIQALSIVSKYGMKCLANRLLRQSTGCVYCIILVFVFQVCLESIYLFFRSKL